MANANIIVLMVFRINSEYEPHKQQQQNNNNSNKILDLTSFENYV